LDAKGYYAILGVSEQAKYYEIRAAYRRLARKYHPDVNSSLPNQEMIKKINAAFEVLSDKDRRKQYDETFFGFNDDNTLQQQYPKDMDNGDDNKDNINEYLRQDKSDRDRDSGSSYGNFFSDSNNNNNNTSEGKYNYKDVNSQTRTSSTPTPTTTTIPGSLDISENRFHIKVEPSLCMAFGSCETLAPKVFVVEKDKMLNPKAKVVSQTAEDFDAIFAAAETCPTKAIIIIDRNTGEQIFP
jgi:curved DNA-binding protein CbpA